MLEHKQLCPRRNKRGAKHRVSREESALRREVVGRGRLRGQAGGGHHSPRKGAATAEQSQELEKAEPLWGWEGRW